MTQHYIPADMHLQQHDCENLEPHVYVTVFLIRFLQFRTKECFEFSGKWYFRLQDPVHLHTESQNIHIPTQVYSYISDPPKDTLQEHVHARQYNACSHEF